MLPTPYNFQRKSIDKLTAVCIEQGACFVFDETGLGKTVISGHIAKNLGDKILVVSPKTNLVNWKKMLPDAEVVTRQKVSVKPYDVVVVDEAHNYRNASGVMYKKLQETIFDGNPDKLPYVIIVTATPYNNSVEEFMNVIGLCPFKISGCAFWGINGAMRAAIDTEKQIIKIRNSITRWGDKNNKSFFDLWKYRSEQRNNLLNLGSFISNFASRNERAEIQEYQHRFPKTEIVKPIKVGFSEDIENLIFQTIVRINWCKFENYNADDNEIPEDVYENNTVAGFLKSFLLKRLDSSAVAFISSVGRIIKKCDQDSEDVKVLNDILLAWSDKSVDFDKQKLSAVSELVDANNGKVIVFSEYIETGEIIAHHFGDRALFITAKNLSDDDQVETIASEFDANYSGKKTNNYQVLVATDALSEGANLHRANLLIHYDQRWNPSKTIQREGRINRLFNEDIEPGVVRVASIETHKDIEDKLGLVATVNNKKSESNYIFEGFKTKPEVFENQHTILFPSGNNLRYNYQGRVVLTTDAPDVMLNNNNEVREVVKPSFVGKEHTTNPLGAYNPKRFEIEHYYKIAQKDFNYQRLKWAMCYSDSLIHYSLFKKLEPLNFANLFESLNNKLKDQNFPLQTWEGYIRS